MHDAENEWLKQQNCKTMNHTPRSSCILFTSFKDGTKTVVVALESERERER